MNKSTKHTLLALSIVTLTACSNVAPKDKAALSAEIDAAYAGHYGQSIRHEEMADHKLSQAKRILAHWEKDQYWNIDDRQKAIDAAQAGAKHRKESEREMCLWLAEVHEKNHHPQHGHHEQHGHHGHHPHHEYMGHHSAVFFADNSAKPYANEEHEIAIVADYLDKNPEATVNIVASTDTVGTEAYNQKLSEKRAAYVTDKLIAHGVKPSQLHVKAEGEAPGPKHVHNGKQRVVSMVVVHPMPSMPEPCADLK